MTMPLVPSVRVRTESNVEVLPQITVEPVFVIDSPDTLWFRSSVISPLPPVAPITAMSLGSGRPPVLQFVPVFQDPLEG